MLFYVLAILLAGLLQGGRAPWFVLGASLCAHLVISWLHGEQLPDLLGIGLMLVGLLSGIALSQWLSIHQLERALARSRGYSLKLQAEISERARAESQREAALEALQQRHRQLAMLHQASTVISSDLALEAVLRSVVEQMVQVLGCTECVLSLWQRERGAIETLVGYSTLRPDEVEPAGAGYALSDYPATRRVLETGQPVLLQRDDPSADPAELALMEDSGTFTLLMLPLVSRDQVIGLVELLDVVAARDYTAEEIQLAQSLATQAALAIEKARLYEQVRQDAETKATLLREVNHRVKNNLALIVSLLYAEQEQAELNGEKACQASLEDLIGRVMGLTTAHNMLSASAWAPLPLSELASRVIDSALQALPLHKHVSVEVFPSPLRVTPEQGQSLALVINELVTNSLKHALRDRPTAHIAVRIVMLDDEEPSPLLGLSPETLPAQAGAAERWVILEFRDDGPGFPEEVLGLGRYNVGFDLIRTIVYEGLHGELTLHNQAGAVTTIRFKAQI